MSGTYKLKRKRVEVAEGKSKTMRLVPRRLRDGRRIVGALNRGEQAKAVLKVKLIDQAGNTRTEKLRVKLKR